MRARWLVAGGGLLMAALVAAGGPLAHVDHQSVAGALANPLGYGFGAVGIAIALRRPENPIGWILLAAGILAATEQTASLYTVAVYLHHRDLPLGRAAVLVQPSWAPAIALYGVAVQLFPTGRLPVGRWRLALWAYLAVATTWAAGAFTIAVVLVARNEIRITPSGDLVQIDHPTGLASVWGVAQSIFFPVLGLTLVAWLAREVPHYRRAAGEHRQQLKLLIAGAVTATVCGFFLIAFSGRHGFLGVVVGVATVGVTALPLSLGIAVLRYRLYEIDRLISRTISYVLVTASLVAVFLGLVLLTTRVLPFSSPVGVAASTLAAVAAFSPLRTRVQRLVDRRFNRAQYDAEATVAAFSQRLRRAVELEAVEAGLLESVGAAVQPSHASVWLRREAALRAAVPPGSRAAARRGA